MQELLQRACTSIIILSVFLGTYFYSSLLFSGLLVLMLFIIIFTELPRLYPFGSWQFWVMALLYPMLPIAALIYLNHRFYAENRLIPLLPSVFASFYDIGAYFIGRTFGRHKIAPTISPGKTWEGVLGGYVAVSVLMIAFFAQKYGILFALGGGIPISVLAQGGDFFESYLKRRAGIKDIGTILPGHGGLLDRFDSHFFVAIGLALFFLFGELEVRNMWEYF